MPINAHPDYLAAERIYLEAETKEQKIRALKKMISHAPSHKGAENLRAQLKRRLAKLKYAKEKEIKQKKGGKIGIKKEGMQVVIIGKTNSGKSSLLKILTNAKPEISSKQFTTKEPIVGMMNYNSVQIQIIEIPAPESEFYDRGIVYTADVALNLITSLEDLNKIKEIRTQGKNIIVFNKIDLLSKEKIRKISATLQSKKYNFQLISTKTKKGVEELKEKIFQNFDKIRIYTKEPGKEPDKTKPIILNPNSTIKDAAEKILKGFSEKIKQIKIWGPSSKFSGQVVGSKHKLKDLDIVEFKTR